MEILIGMAGEGQRREAGLLDDDAELFGQFANQRLFRPLARIDLAAGEFPEIGELLALGALGDQHAVVGVDQGDGDDQQQFHGRARLRLTTGSRR